MDVSRKTVARGARMGRERQAATTIEGATIMTRTAPAPKLAPVPELVTEQPTSEQTAVETAPTINPELAISPELAGILDKARASCSQSIEGALAEDAATNLADLAETFAASLTLMAKALRANPTLQPTRKRVDVVTNRYGDDSQSKRLTTLATEYRKAAKLAAEKDDKAAKLAQILALSAELGL